MHLAMRVKCDGREQAMQFGDALTELIQEAKAIGPVATADLRHHYDQELSQLSFELCHANAQVRAAVQVNSSRPVSSRPTCKLYVSLNCQIQCQDALGL